MRRLRPGYEGADNTKRSNNGKGASRINSFSALDIVRETPPTARTIPQRATNAPRISATNMGLEHPLGYLSQKEKGIPYVDSDPELHSAVGQTNKAGVGGRVLAGG